MHTHPHILDFYCWCKHATDFLKLDPGSNIGERSLVVLYSRLMIVLSIVNDDSFISTFLVLILLPSVSLVNSSRTMLKGSSDSRHSYLMPNLEGNVP